jgi:hypothetical protein
MYKANYSNIIRRKGETLGIRAPPSLLLPYFTRTAAVVTTVEQKHLCCPLKQLQIIFFGFHSFIRKQALRTRESEIPSRAKMSVLAKAIFDVFNYFLRDDELNRPWTPKKRTTKKYQGPTRPTYRTTYLVRSVAYSHTIHIRKER